MPSNFIDPTVPNERAQTPRASGGVNSKHQFIDPTATDAPEPTQSAAQRTMPRPGGQPLPSHKATPERPGWDGVPEFPAFASVPNYHIARTPGGQVNIIKKHYPDAQLDFVDGQPVVQFDNDHFGEKGRKFLLNRPGVSMQDVPNISAGALKVLPVMAAGAATSGLGLVPSMLATGVAGGGIEALSQGAANAAGADEGYDVQDIVLAGGLSAGGEGVGRLIGKVGNAAVNVYRRIANKAVAAEKLINADGTLNVAVVRELKKQGIDPQAWRQMVEREYNGNVNRALNKTTNALTGTEAMRLKQFEQAGLRQGTPTGPTAAQITRNPVQFADEVNLQNIANPKTGESIGARWGAQNRQLLHIAEQGGKAAGEVDPFKAGEKVSGALRETSKHYQKQVGRLYEKAMNQFGEHAPVALADDVTGESKSLFLQSLKENSILDDANNTRYTAAVTGKLKEWGVLGEDGVIARDITLREVDTMTKLLNKLYGSATPTGKSIIGAAKDALDSDVESALMSDVFAGAKSEAAKRFSTFGAKKGPLKVVSGLLDESIAPEDVFQRVVVRGKFNELRGVKDALTKDLSSELKRSPALAAKSGEAWNDLRAQTWAYLYRGATKNKALDQFGMRQFRGDHWLTAMDQIGDKKLRELFSSSEINQLRSIGNVGLYRMPPVVTKSTLNPSGSGRELERLVMKWMDKMPVIGSYLNAPLRGAKEFAEKSAQGEAASSALAGAASIAKSRIAPPISESVRAMTAATGAGAGMGAAEQTNEGEALLEALRGHLRR